MNALKPVHTHTQSVPTVGRQSLPQFGLFKPVRRLNHRQSAPGVAVERDEDIFDKRFISLEPLGKGAFSQVIKVKERSTDQVYAIKKARGVFEGAKDRLRHLEEVDILRHLSSNQHRNVIRLVDAWEQVSTLESLIATSRVDLTLGTTESAIVHTNRALPGYSCLFLGRIWTSCGEIG